MGRTGDLPVEIALRLESPCLRTLRSVRVAGVHLFSIASVVASGAWFRRCPVVGDVRGRVPRRALFAAVGLALALSAGCSTGDTPAPGPSSAPSALPTAAPTSTPSAADVAGGQALAAYQGMWADFVTAGATSDWQSPNLGHHATGVALTNLSRGLYADRVNGLVTRGEPLLSPTVSSAEPTADPTRVVVTDCGDSTRWLKHRVEDDAIVNAGSGGRRLINAVVERQSDGSWKVSDYGVQGVGSC